MARYYGVVVNTHRRWPTAWDPLADRTGGIGLHVNVPTEAACSLSLSLLAGATGFYWSGSHAPVEGTRMARRKANKKSGSSTKSEGPLPVSRLLAAVRILRAEQRHLPFRHRLRPRLSPPEEPGQLLQGRYGF